MKLTAIKQNIESNIYRAQVYEQTKPEELASIILQDLLTLKVLIYDLETTGEKI